MNQSEVRARPAGCFRKYLTTELTTTFLLRKHANFYWPQRSWAKVIFSQACVKNSVHTGGEGVCLSACWDTPPRKQPPPQTRQTHPPPPWTRQTPRE